MASDSITAGNPLASPPPSQPVLLRTSLIREVFRSLINTGRTYAAFTQQERCLIQSLRYRGRIFDPMSGYGLVARFSAEIGVSSSSVEFNLPQYLWQVLRLPTNLGGFVNAIDFLLSSRRRWPRPSVRAVVGEEFFSEDSKRILLSLLRQSQTAIDACFQPSQAHFAELALALLLPFSGRLSCSVPGDISTHTKPGGMCVLRGWQNDFVSYLNAIGFHLQALSAHSQPSDHEIQLGDARTISLPRGAFGGMLTSPPYPNRQDFASTFNVEHALLKWLKDVQDYDIRMPGGHIIGSRFVADREDRKPRSRSALSFLRKVGELRRDQKAVYDDKTYYIPYFQHYFTDLEDAYQNIRPALKKSFEGYIIVVDNTHRNIVVPVASTVIEIWRSMGFRAEIFRRDESFHIGTKNPRARGLRARHTEYVIRVWR